MSSIVCLKLSYRVFREDLSACVSPLNSDPAVVTREALEYTCGKKKQRQNTESQQQSQIFSTHFTNNIIRFVPAVCGPAPGFSAGAAV